MRWLAAMLALTVPASAEPAAAPPKEPSPALRAGDAFQAESEQRARQQAEFYGRIERRSSRAMGSICAGCGGAAKPARSRPERERPPLDRPDTAGGVEDE